MVEIRFHGLGGHGAVMASKFLADAAARSDYQSQSFASYGALRRGGKVESYVRISENPIRPHCKLYEPDWLVLMDESLVEDRVALSGLKSSGGILINSGKTPSAFTSLMEFKVHTVDAYHIARDKGLVLPGGMPVINTTILGALTAVLDLIPLREIVAVILEETPKPDQNVACAELGFKRVVSAPMESGFKTQGQGTAPDHNSGSKFYPVYDQEKMNRCDRCQICYMVCPSLAITFTSSPFSISLNQNICNQCGICVQECPKNAIFWREKSRD